MKSNFPSAGMRALTLAVAALSGCATGNDAQHKQHHPAAASSPPPVATGSGPAPADEQMKMNMTAMCDMHRKMMSTKAPGERMAMMGEHMQGMSPEMMQKHMDMMQEQCK